MADFAGSSRDFVTVLTGRALAAKVIRPNEQPKPAGWGSFFTVDAVPVDTLADLYDVLLSITRNPRSLVIRDRPKAATAAPVRRNHQNFEPADHHWLMLDFDGIEAPPAASPTDLHTVDWLIRTQLRPAFHNADYIAHFSSTAGTQWAGRRIKVHLFFWLAQPARSADLKPWATSVGADPALFHPVQPHFIADPVFEGCPDPFNGVRLFHVQKGNAAVGFVPPPAATLPTVARHKGNGSAPGIVRDAHTGRITDGREGWLLDRLYRNLEQRLSQGGSIAFAALEAEAWADFQAECDLAGWSRAAVAGKVHSTLDRYERGLIPSLKRRPYTGVAPYYVTRTQPLAAIRTEMQTAGNDFFAHAAEGEIAVLAAPPGAGKSTMVLAALRSFEGTTDFYAPTLDLAEQCAAELGPDLARVIRGRGQPDPDNPGNAMCLRSDVAGQVSKAGLSVMDTLCRGCPHHRGCAYLAQWHDPPRVLVMAHNYLGLPRPAAVRRADRIVIDEAFLGVAHVRGSFPAGDLSTIPSWSVARAIREGLQDGRLLTALHTHGITPDMIRAARRGVFKDTPPGIKGSMPDGEIKARLKHHKPVSRLAGFLGWLANELEAMKPTDAGAEAAALYILAAWLGLFATFPWAWRVPGWATERLRDLIRATPLTRDTSHVA